jgi:putative Mn2+ efflux pump MntP
MLTLLLLGIGLGFDSFRASAALGVLPMRRRDWVYIVLAFGLCDGVAPLAGLALGKSLGMIHRWAPMLGSAAVGTYGLVVMLKTLRSEEAARSNSQRSTSAAIPVVLSLDNLAAGVGLGSFGFPALFSAVVLGVCSALMSIIGLCLGHAVAERIPRIAESFGGAALMLLGVAGLCGML